MKPCANCGKLAPLFGPQKVCSDACRKERKRKQRAVVNARYLANKSAVRTQTPETPTKAAMGRVEPAKAISCKCLTCGEPCKRYESAACYKKTQWEVCAAIVGVLGAKWGRRGAGGLRGTRERK